MIVLFIVVLFQRFQMLFSNSKLLVKLNQTFRWHKIHFSSLLVMKIEERREFPFDKGPQDLQILIINRFEESKKTTV